jgi:Ni,Fe-hydrogenase III large subunit
MSQTLQFDTPGAAALHATHVDAARWHALAVELARNRNWALLAHWGEPEYVYAALLDRTDNGVAVIVLPCPSREFPSIGAHHAPAIRLERTIRDLYGHVPLQSPDPRPWLDHGQWHGDQPSATKYSFLAAEGEGLHQIAVGPVHAGIIEPGHFRFTANGETVVRLEQWLGYVHRGIESLWPGSSYERAAQLAGRLSGDSTVAGSLALARAVEAALAINAPPRAHALRALMAELERIANHLGDIGAVCNDAAFALMHAHCAVLRERVLRASAAAFGHRLMMDRVVPGGVAADIDAAGRAAIRALCDEIRRHFPRLVELYDGTPSLQDRTVGTGVLSNQLAEQYAAGGFVGRASGRDFDARRSVGYAPYDRLTFDVPCRDGGDVNDRVWIRILEVEQSLAIVDQLLADLPGGALRQTLPNTSGFSEGIALVEGFRGDVFAWVRIASGTIDRAHIRDPSWFQWPLLEAVIEGNIVADFPLCNKSFNCSYAGHDL